MLGLSGAHEINRHAYFSWPSVIHLVLMLIFCDFGKAGIVVYDGSLVVDEFPDIELQYTRPIRRNGIEGLLVAANPLHACSNISRPPDMNGSLHWFVLMSGNECSFEIKVLNARLAGYSLGIIYTYRGRIETPSNERHNRFYSDMPAVVVKTEHGVKMKENYLFSNFMRYRLVVFPNNSFSIMSFLLLFSIIAGLFLVIMLILTVIRFCEQSNSVPNGCLSSQHLQQLETSTFQKGDHYDTCAICLEDYKDQDKLRILPCSHGYHMKCIDPWLTNNRRICPVCKRKVILAGGTSSNPMDRNFRETETTPLLHTSRVDPSGTFNCSNEPVVVNPNHPDLSVGQSAAGNAHSMSGGAIPPERQSVLSFLQI